MNRRRLARQMRQSRAALNRPVLPIEEPPHVHTRTLHGVVIVQTYVVARPGRDRGLSHFEIHIAPDRSPIAPCTVLLTRDRGVYECALGAEGSDRRFGLAVHTATRGGRPCLALDSPDEETL